MLLAALARSSSHGGLSFTSFATWVGGAAGIAYFLELIGVLGWLRRKLPLLRPRPQSLVVTRALDAASVGVAVALVFVSGFSLKVALVVVLATGFVTRLVVNRHQHGRASSSEREAAEVAVATSPSFRVAEAWEQTAPDPEPRHSVYLRITNDGPSAPFYAQVVQVTGSVTEPSVPWTIRWRGSSERQVTIHQGTTEVLHVLEVVPMGDRPHEGSFQPGVMIAPTLVGEVEMRISAQRLDDLYVNELRLAVVVVNVDSGERENLSLRVGLENAPGLSPRLNLFHQEPPPADDSHAHAAAVEINPIAVVGGRRGVTRGVPRIEFGEARLTQPKAYRFGGAVGDTLTTIVLPVRARGGRIVNSRASVTFTAPWAGYTHEVPGRWENRTKQPMRGFGEDWSELDRITLYEHDTDDIAIAVQHEGDDDAFILCNRSWEMPLQHGQPDFRHPELLLPRGRVEVEVTVRGDELEDSSCTFSIEPTDGVWRPCPPLTQPPTEKVHALLREGVELSNAIPYGTELEPDSLHERAVTAWTHRVRDALSADYPEWAVPFDNPVRRLPPELKYRSDELKAEMDSRLHRLSWIGQQLRGTDRRL